MNRKRGSSLLYWRIFSFVLIVFLIIILIMVPVFLGIKFVLFESASKKIDSLLSPEENTSFGEDISIEENVSSERDVTAEEDEGFFEENIIGLNESLGDANATGGVSVLENASAINESVGIAEENTSEMTVNASLGNMSAENASEATINVSEENISERVTNASGENASGSRRIIGVEISESVNERIMIGKPVKWTKKVKIEEKGVVSLPKEAENIIVKKEGEEITLSPAEENGFSFVNLLKKLLSVLTGRASGESEIAEIIEDADSKDVIITEPAEYEIEFTTPAPSVAEEKVGENKKRVIVSAPDLGYKDILTFTSIPEILPVGKEDLIKVFWVEQKRFEPFSAFDSDDNGFLDYIEWNTPYLSQQTFEIILITKAVHLDSNRAFVEDVYDAVKERDGNWKEIPVGDYVRVTFERNLSSDRDITIYARSNYSGSVSVYEKDGIYVIADFGMINEDKMYKIYLTNLVGEQDTFDLLVKGGSVEFEHIVDPQANDTLNNVYQCGTIDSPGAYTQNQSIMPTLNDNCINITTSNVVFNGNGYWIRNDTLFEKSGIYAGNVVNITIRNANVTMGGANGEGISFNRVNNSLIENSSLRAAGFNSAGIFLIGANNIIKNNIITNSSYGIAIFSSSKNNTIKNNILNLNRDGFYLEYSYNNSLIDNLFDSNEETIYLFASSQNLISGGMINNSKKDAIYLQDYSTKWNNFTNITIINTNVSGYDIYGDNLGSSGENYFIDIPYIGNYSFTDSSGGTFFSFKNSKYGEIKFLQPSNATGNNLTRDIFIGNNSVIVRSDSSIGLNRSANITLYGIGNRFNRPVILKNGLECKKGCWNFTALNSNIVVFNVSSWTEYTIGEFGMIPSCAELDSENGVYKMVSSLDSDTTCFTVRANNITLDCQKNTINYSRAGGSNNYGVHVNGANFTTIKNCTITTGSVNGQYNYGVYLNVVNNSVIFNNTIMTLSSGSDGIIAIRGNNNSIRENLITIRNLGAQGVEISGGVGNEILKNNINHTGGSTSDGILIDLSSNNSVIGDNVIRVVRASGVRISDSFNASVFNNSIYSTDDGEGIYLYKGYNNKIENNVISTIGGIAYGIYGILTGNVSVSNNNISTFGSTSYGIAFMQSGNITILNNNISTFGNTGMGIVLSLSRNGVLKNNNIVSYGAYGHGFVFSSVFDNNLSNNNIITYNDFAMGILFGQGSNANAFRNMSFKTAGVFSSAIYVDSGNHNYSIYDSVLNASGAGVPDFNVSGADGGTWNFTNVTRADGISPINITWPAGANGTLNMHWYLDAYANYTNGTEASNANISAFNVSGAISFSALTGSGGRIARQALLGYWQNATFKGDQNNYTFNATNPVGFNNLTRSWNITTNRDLVFTFKDLIPPNIFFVPPTPDNNSVLKESAYVNVSSSDDLGEHSVILDWNRSLVLWMRMDDRNSGGDPWDRSSYSNNGTRYGAAYIPAGKLGGAFSFDGINDYISIDGSDFQVASKTISFWINKKSFSGSYEKIFSLVPGNNYHIWMTPGYFYATWVAAAGFTVNAPFAVSPPFDVWTHYSVVFNVSGSNVGVTLFKNGGIVGSFLDNNGYSTSYGNVIEIGKWGGSYFHGGVDDIQFYNRALSPEEINASYNANLYKYGHNFTNLAGGNYEFRAYAQDLAGNLNWTEERTINVDATAPRIMFVPPTPANGSSVSPESVNINVSIVEENLREVKFNWNGTNYTIYDDSLLLMMNFDNRSELGENDTLVRDLSIYGNNGIVNGSAVWNDSGRYNGAYWFDGAEDYINTGNSSSFNQDYRGGMTISLWGYLRDGSINMYFVSKSNQTRNYEPFSFGYGQNNDGYISASFRNGGASVSARSNYGILNSLRDRWVHYVAVFMPNNYAKLYINGKENDSSPATLASLDIAQDIKVMIGSDNDGGRKFNGSIDEVRIWNRSLSSEEVRELYMLNLNKYDNNNWGLYVGQRKNSVEWLDFGNYTYFAYAKDSFGNENMTDTRTVYVGDVVAPRINFTYPTPANGSLRDKVYPEINVSISEYESNLGEVKFNWNGTNYTVYNDSLVLMFNFDNRISLGENYGSACSLIRDLSNKGNDGYVGDSGCGAVNMPYWSAFGKYGGALGFNRTSTNVVYVPASDSLNNLQRMTLAVWVYKDGDMTRDGRIVAKEGAADTAYGIQTEENDPVPNKGKPKCEMTIGGGTNPKIHFSINQLPLREWTYIVCTYNGNEMNIYVNGDRANTPLIVSGAVEVSSNVLSIGNKLPALDRQFNGLIDEVRIWNRALSQEEIRELYMLNLNKYDNNNWSLYVRQGKNGTAPLELGNYTYFASAKDIYGNENMTETRVLLSALGIVDIDDIGYFFVDGRGYIGINPGNVNNIKFSTYIFNSCGGPCSGNVVNASFYRGSIIRDDPSCDYVGALGAILNYSCTVGIWYFDSAGEWKVNATFVDGGNAYKDSREELFNLLEEVSVSHQGALDYGILDPGTTPNLAKDFLLNNTGNAAFGEIRIKGNNLLRNDVGPENIPASNFRVDDISSSACSATQMLSGTSILIPDVNLQVGNNSINSHDAASGQEELFICLTTVPGGLSGGNYRAGGANSWELTTLPPHFW